MVKLVHLQLDDLPPQLAVLLQHLLQLGLLRLRRHWQLAELAARLPHLLFVDGLLVLAVRVRRHWLCGGLWLGLVPVGPSLFASHAVELL